MTKNPTRRAAMWQSALCACLGLAAAAWLTGFDREIGRQAIWLAVLPAVWAGGYRFLMETDRRMKTCFGVLGGLFMGAVALGARLSVNGDTGWDGLAAGLLIALCAGPAAAEGFLWLYRGFTRLSARMALGARKAFWLAFGVMLLCWLPVIIAYFPGITGYDMDFQMDQLRRGAYSSHHPLLHTLFIGLFWKLGALLGNESAGYGAHTVAQAVLLAASIAYALSWLNTLRCHKGFWYALLAYFALSPQHAVLAVSGTKDVLFAAAMLVSVVELCRLLSEPERRARRGVLAWDAAVIALAGLLRNNAVYALALTLLVSFLFFRRKVGRRVLCIMLAGMMAAAGGAAALERLTQARGVSVREMLSIPCQQLARVYAKYGLDAPVGYEIREVLPDAENYAPDRADFTKRSAKVTTPERLTRFFKLWAREAVHYPIEYIDAFLYNTRGFWDLQDTSFATTYDAGPGSSVGCLVLRHDPVTGIERWHALPGLEALLHDWLTLNGYQRFPVLWMLLHPALYTWLMGFALAWAAWRRRREVLLPACVLMGYLLTLLIGPCAIIRYQYDLMLSAPILLGYLWAREKQPLPDA